ncbi:ABC transporter ATP-binding protein [Plantactinospora siamensis]|uniref:ABC transporter ATP-binding protein n=1 Tax=Plantactinospora siamensis TaxID=555372 RepID=A0ABV6P1D8_9ACTN
MSPAAPAGRRRRAARALRSARAAFGLAVRAAPGATAADVVSTVLLGLTPVLTAWLTKLVIDRLTTGGLSAREVVTLGVGLTLLGSTAAALPHLRRYLEAERTRAVSRLVRQRLYAAVQRFVGLARLEDPAFQDRLQVAQQTGHIGPGQLAGNTLAALQSLIGMTGFLGVLVAMSPPTAVLVLLAAVPTLVIQLRLNRRRVAMMVNLEHFQRRDMFFAQLLVGIPAAKEVRLFGLGRYFGDRMLAELRGMHAQEHRLDRREMRAQATLGLLGAVAAGTGIIYTVGIARSGSATAGDVALFLAAVPGVQSALAGIVGQLGTMHQALLMFAHYQAVVEAEPDLPRPAAPAPTPALRSRIELRDVWFRYSPEHPWVLRGVDLDLPYGSTVALVGLNGAGKSTLVKLLCRFYDPERGSIRWEGTDLRDLDPAALRERIGVVFQDFMAYDLTAAENIGVGDLGSAGDRDRLRAAARAAGADEVLDRLPRGYDTLLTRVFHDGDDGCAGVVLSGGQWQRVALARAFLRANRDLLILDEPSSGLDAEAEHDLHRRLRDLRTGATSLLISHRLNAVREADLIVVLDEGRVVERGNHAELLARGGRYARLFALQSRGYRDPGPEESKGPLLSLSDI